MSELKVIDIMAVNAKNRKVVKFTNIDDETFTHSYDGVQLTLRAGASQAMPWMEADHYSTHLARKMLSKRWKERGGDRMKSELKYTNEQVEEMKKDMIADLGELDAPENLDKTEAKRREREALNEKFGVTEKKPVPEISKKDVINELTKRGQKVDIAKSKEELLNQLMDLEIIGK